MPAATIKINSKAAPEPGKKRWKVKSESGHTFQVPAEIADDLQVGRTYETQYKDDQFKEHKFRVIESVKEVAEVVRSMAGPSSPIVKQSTDYPPYDKHKDESIAALAILKCYSPLPVGDRVAAFHALKSAALAWRDFKKWQVDGNIETGRQPLQKEHYAEFPEGIADQ